MSRRSFVAGAASVIGAGALVACGDGSSGSAGGSSIVVASVNNGPFMRLKEYVPEFTEKTGISVEFVMLTENDIRSKIQQDASVGGGQFDVVTLGSTDAGPYLDNGWTQPLQPLLDSMDEDAAAEYDAEDLIAANIAAYSSQEKGLAAMPFYGESTMLMYRTDLFEEAGLKMPEEPTWEDVQEFAAALHGPGAGTVGMAIRGKAGYGENMYLFNTIMNAYGGQIADMNWTPGYESPEMAEALEFYKRLQRETGAAEATSNGFTETLNLMSSGGAAIYYDATVAADVFESDDSAIKGKVGYAALPGSW
ncbi:extracellular solute-binding protein [Brachybacterium sp. AOP24-D1-21]|uniref:extracellular solute-binding protein n=1 Tax=Brachybacterium sp. AOP24-D1-21 TaxID=3457711 RepID=UPI00403342D9